MLVIGVLTYLLSTPDPPSVADAAQDGFQS